MDEVPWQVEGEYFETCSCDYLCPCVPSSLAGKPTKGSCTFAMVFRVDHGHHGDVRLDDTSFAAVGWTPGIMGEGNWSVGLIIDQRASKAQVDALTAIASGQAGGPMANLSALIGTFLGVEQRPITVQANGMSRSVSIPGVLDQAVEGVAGGANSTEPIYLDNTLHPANPRLALAKATRSHLHAFNLNWDDASGRNNGHFAAFNWKR